MSANDNHVTAAAYIKKSQLMTAYRTNLRVVGMVSYFVVLKITPTRMSVCSVTSVFFGKSHHATRYANAFFACSALEIISCAEYSYSVTITKHKNVTTQDERIAGEVYLLMPSDSLAYFSTGPIIPSALFKFSSLEST